MTGRRCWSHVHLWQIPGTRRRLLSWRVTKLMSLLSQPGRTWLQVAVFTSRQHAVLALFISNHLMLPSKIYARYWSPIRIAFSPHPNSSQNILHKKSLDMFWQFFRTKRSFSQIRTESRFKNKKLERHYSEHAKGFVLLCDCTFLVFIFSDAFVMDSEQDEFPHMWMFLSDKLNPGTLQFPWVLNQPVWCLCFLVPCHWKSKLSWSPHSSKMGFSSNNNGSLTKKQTCLGYKTWLCEVFVKLFSRDEITWKQISRSFFLAQSEIRLLTFLFCAVQTSVLLPADCCLSLQMRENKKLLCWSVSRSSSWFQTLSLPSVIWIPEIVFSTNQSWLFRFGQLS